MDQLQRTFRLADAADIAFLSLVLYALFMWFRSTGSRQILVGIGVLAAVYLVARAFNMYMTAALFQAGLAFVAVAAIVVFQEDLRRACVQLAALGRLPRLRGAKNGIELDVIIETVFDLARKKVGALLVIQGKEPLQRHIRGGVALDARISRALFDSIFDPHSMGHDGAVLIIQDRIHEFAAHLPLSQNVEQLGARGTRHCAALGLSEVSDAVVIVVSEERGEVSIAEGGRLEVMEGPIGLKHRLERVTRRLQPPSRGVLRRQILVENPGTKIASILLACAIWFIVSFETETVQKTFVIPIEYRNLPETLDMDDTAPTEARVTLSGLERAFTLLAPSAMTVSLDLSRIETGRQQIVIDDSHLKLPSNISLFRSTPRVVSFGVHRWARSQVAIEPRTEGRLPMRLTLREIAVAPSTAKVSMWESFRRSTTTVFTEPIDLGRITESTELTARLVLPEHIRLEPDQPAILRVKIDVVAAQGQPATAAGPP